MTDEKENFMSSVWLYPFLWRFKWLILGGALIGALTVYIGTLFITPKYEASAIVYAAGENNNNKLALSQGNTLLLLQFLESSFLKDSLNKRCQLTEHYGIDTGSKNWKQQLNNHFSKNVSFKRTLYNSVRIRVLDHDPEFAAMLANSIVSTSNDIKNKIFKDNTKKQLETIKAEYLRKEEQINIMSAEIALLKNENIEKVNERLNNILVSKEQKISNLRHELKTIREEAEGHELNQILDEVRQLYTKTQSQYYYEAGKLETYENNLPQYDSLRIRTEGKVKGLSNKMKLLKEKLDQLNKINDRYNKLLNELSLQINLRDQLVNRIETIKNTYEPGVISIEMQKKEKYFQSEMEQFSLLKKKYEEAETRFNVNEPASYLISKAEPDFNKAYPKKWMLTGIGFILSGLFAFFILLIIKK